MASSKYSRLNSPIDWDENFLKRLSSRPHIKFFENIEWLLKTIYVSKKKRRSFLAVGVLIIIICIIVIAIYNSQFAKLELVLGLYTLIATIVWISVFFSIRVLDIVLNDQTFGQMKGYNQLGLISEIFTMFLPICIIWYKWKYTNDTIIPLIKTNPELARLKIEANMQREDTIISIIPVILFGVGSIFEKQQFMYNRFLLGGVFFGTVIPLVINSVMLNTTDIRRLSQIENIKFSFLSMGLTMILISLTKYYIFKSEQRQLKKKLKIKESTTVDYKELGENIVGLVKENVSREFLDSLKKCAGKL